MTKAYKRKNKENKEKLTVNTAMVVVWNDLASGALYSNSSPQGSELSGWKTGHFTQDGFDIFQNFPDLNSILWDAEDKGMVPKLTPNHHVPLPESFKTNSSVRMIKVCYNRASSLQNLK